MNRLELAELVEDWKKVRWKLLTLIVLLFGFIAWYAWVSASLSKNLDSFLPTVALGSSIFLLIPIIYFLYRYFNFYRDMAKQRKIGREILIYQKERTYSENRFFIVSSKREKIELEENHYHQLSKGDSIILWKSKYSKYELALELCFHT
ncbi:MAG: hypothetical protein AAF696_20445 [Bacteroidota bacterium]